LPVPEYLESGVSRLKVKVGYAAGWLWLDLIPYMPAFPRLPVSGKPELLSYVFGTGLGVSPGIFFEDGIIQNEVGYDSLQAGVLLLQLLQPMSLVHFHAAKLFSPAVVGDVADTNLLAGDSDGVPLAE
jgi:hypothetical protein